ARARPLGGRQRATFRSFREDSRRGCYVSSLRISRIRVRYNLAVPASVCLPVGAVCARLQATEEGHVRRRVNLIAETLIGSVVHAGWSLRERVEEVAIVTQARSQSPGLEPITGRAVGSRSPKQSSRV